MKLSMKKVAQALSPSTDELGTIWIVLSPRDDQDTVADLVIEGTVKNAMFAAKGGIEPARVYGVFTDPERAQGYAQTLLDNFSQGELEIP